MPLWIDRLSGFANLCFHCLKKPSSILPFASFLVTENAQEIQSLAELHRPRFMNRQRHKPHPNPTPPPPNTAPSSQEPPATPRARHQTPPHPSPAPRPDPRSTAPRPPSCP